MTDENEQSIPSRGSAVEWHPQWVSVEVRMPSIGEEIYAIRIGPACGGLLDIAQLYVDNAGVWRENGGASNYPEDFTHWMPASRK